MLVVSPGLDVGGIERHLSLLLPRLAARGFAVRVLTLKWEGRFFTELADSGLATRCLHIGGRGAMHRLPRVLGEARGRPDVILSTGFNGHAVGAILARMTGAKHFLHWQRMLAHGAAITGTQRSIMRAVARAGDEVIVAASHSVRELQEFGFAKHQLHVIPNGTASRPEALGDNRDQVRAALSLDDGDLLAALVARLRPEKEVHTFIAGVADAHRRDPRVRGVVVGDGPEAARLSDLAGRSDGAVTMLGHHDRPWEVVGAADVFCLTSRAEVLPLAILEAMALGRPVVATPVGGTPDAVVPDETGLLIDVGRPDQLADQLLRLVDDRALLSRLGDGARRRHAELFTIERMVDGYAERLAAA